MYPRATGCEQWSQFTFLSRFTWEDTESWSGDVACGHSHRPPGFDPGLWHLLRAASMKLSDALGLEADLCPRWRQSNNQSYSTNRMEAQRAAVISPKRYSVQ